MSESLSLPEDFGEIVVDLDLNDNDILNVNTLNYNNLNPPIDDSKDGFISATEIVVNPTVGDDGTGTRGEISLPFLTLAAAYAASQPGGRYYLSCR